MSSLEALKRIRNLEILLGINLYPTEESKVEYLGESPGGEKIAHITVDKKGDVIIKEYPKY